MNRFFPEFMVFLTGFLVVSLYFLPPLKPAEGIQHLMWLLPQVLIPLVGLGVWIASLRNRRFVPTPGLFWAFAVISSIAIGLWLKDFEPLPMRRALFTLIPFLFAPILFQEMTKPHQRRSLQALAAALLVVSMYEVLLQYFLTLPSLQIALEDHPGAVANYFGLSLADLYGFEDLKARINGQEVFAHFLNANLLSINLLLLGAIAWAARYRFLVVVALVGLLLASSKGVWVAILIAFPFIILTGKRPHLFRLALLAGVISLFLWHPLMNKAITYLKSEAVQKTVVGNLAQSTLYRLSYWQTARHMSETVGPVGLGQYDRYASMARVDGGRYAQNAHNGFLQLVAELGLPAALAALFWIASLFGGRLRLREARTQGRHTFVWGAIAAMALVILSGNGEFHVGVVVNDLDQVVQRWPGLDWVVCVTGFILFVITILICLNIQFRIRFLAYPFAAFALLFHSFIDIDFFSPAVVVLALICAALGWERRSKPFIWSWFLYPLLCLLVLVGLFEVIYPSYEKSNRDPQILTERFQNGEIPLEIPARQEFFERWHDLDPTNPEPLYQLMQLSPDTKKRQWAFKYLATRPADPSFQLAGARWFYQRGEAPDIIRRLLRRIKELDSLPTLPRHRLSAVEREVLAQLEQIFLLENRGQP